jgi:hypothetical protein
MVQRLPLEYRLLLACPRTTIDNGQQERIRQLIDAGPDWNRLVSLARHQGLCLFLQRSLLTVNKERVPATVIEQLTTLATSYRQRNLVLVAELLRVMAILEGAGIAVIPYKGPALAQSVYGDFALREFVDLDLIIKPADAIKARRALMTAGLPPAHSVSRLAEQLLRYFHCECSFVVLREVKLEINWRQAPAYWQLPRLDDDMWARLGSLRLAGVDTPSLDPIDLLIVLCVHGCKHGWSMLKWIVDIAELLRVEPQLDWSLMNARAHDIGAAIMLEVGLVLAHEFLQVPLPADVLETARRRSRTMTLVNEVQRRLSVQDIPGCTIYEHLSFVGRAAQKPGAKIMPYLLMPAYFVLHRLVRPAAAQVSGIIGR